MSRHHSRQDPSLSELGRGRRRPEAPPQGEGPSAEPFFSARVVGDHVEVAGLHECRLGHRLASSNGTRPDGVYAGWDWDGRRLEVSSDRYGFYPLYYFADDRRVIVSTSIPTLLALGAPRTLDDAALAVYLRLGCFLGDDTPFEGIRCVPPDADFTWAPGALHVVGRLALGKNPGLSRDDAIDAYVTLFRRAMERRVGPAGDGVMLPLSGGQDSRHIVLELVRQGRAPSTAITVRFHPPRRDEDVEARALATRLKIRHVVLDQTHSLFDASREVIARQNLCSSEHSWVCPLVDYVRGRASALYDGIGGDILSAGLFLDAEGLALYRSGRLTVLAERLFGSSSALKLPRRWLGRRLNFGLAVERLRRELTRHVEAPNPIGSFYFWNRTRRCIAQSGYRLLDGVPLVFSPYLDHELYDLLAGLPATMLLDHTFHAEAIARAYPEANDIPYAPKPVFLPGGSRAMTAFSRDMLADALRRIGSRLVNPTYLLPRLARCLVNREYAGSAPWFARQALYLWALEDALAADAG